MFLRCVIDKKGALYRKTGGKDHAGREAGRDAGPEGLRWEGRWVGRSKLGGKLGERTGKKLGGPHFWNGSRLKCVLFAILGRKLGGRGQFATGDLAVGEALGESVPENRPNPLGENWENAFLPASVPTISAQCTLEENPI